MSTLVVEPAASLVGTLRVPGDKSVSHRALLLAALAEGESQVHGLSAGDDVVCTTRAIRAMGATVSHEGDTHRIVSGADLLHEPRAAIDVGNSGTGIRLLAGVASGLPWLTVLQGDDSIAGRPMGRVVDPLRAMGVTIDGRADGRLPPLVIRGGGAHGIDYTLPMPSAQVKAAILFAGLAADGATTVRETLPSRAHTEELFRLTGVDIDASTDGLTSTVRPSRPKPFELAIPGDPSQAAFWIVAALLLPGSVVTVEDVYVGRARADFLGVLQRMGGDLDIVPDPNQPNVATITARHSPGLHGTVVEGDEVPGLIDEIPILAVAAAMAEGPTEFRDAAELRVKETDRVATTAAMLDALGAWSEPRPDGLFVTGGTRFTPGLVDAAGDHRIAMAGVIAALTAGGSTRIQGFGAVQTSYPTFEAHLRQLAVG